MIRNDENGFTLTELLVAMTMSLIVLGAVSAVYRVQAHTVKVQEYRMEAQEYARVALDMMVREVRNTGYFPNLTACTTSPANTKGIISATNVSIRVVYDANGDADCADADEDIIYSWDSTTRNISRTITVDSVAQAPQTLTDGNITNLRLRYFGSDGTELTSPVSASDLSKIKRVSVELTVLSKSTDTQFHGQQTIAMNSNAELRNRF